MFKFWFSLKHAESSSEIYDICALLLGIGSGLAYMGIIRHIAYFDTYNVCTFIYGLNIKFLAIGSGELFWSFWSSVVRRWCRCCGRKLFTFLATGPVSTNANLAEIILGEEDSSLFKWCARPFPRGDNFEISKTHRRILKSFFSRTAGPISTKIGTNHLCVKGIQVCSDGGFGPLPRSDN